MNDKRIFFLVTDNNEPSGGRMFIYHLVDILNGNGFEAYALHQKRNFRYTWFPNDTLVVYTYQIKKQRIRSNRLKHFLRVYWNIIKDYLTSPQRKTDLVNITNQDVIVLPATRTLFCDEILPGIPKISLSQGPYLLFQSGGIGNKKTSIFHPDIRARIVMSKLNHDIHRLVFEEDFIWEVPVFIDKRFYGYAKDKKRQIAYMPRKLPNDSSALINLLKLRNNLYDFSFVPIDGMSQQQSSHVLKESLLFLSFSYREGFGLPPAEAMACGCIVIGYSGNGGNEFLDDDVCFKISEGDIFTYTKTVEDVIRQYVKNPEALDQMRKMASERILQSYSRETTERVLMNSWQEIMDVINN